MSAQSHQPQQPTDAPVFAFSKTNNNNKKDDDDDDNKHNGNLPNSEQNSLVEKAKQTAQKAAVPIMTGAGAGAFLLTGAKDFGQAAAGFLGNLFRPGQVGSY